MPLPEPTIAEGIDGPALRAKLEAVPGRHAPVEELLRNSIVAGLVVHFRDVEAKDQKLPVHGCDVWFVAYGELEPLTKQDFMDDLLRSQQKDAKIRVLAPADLTQRKITLAGGEKAALQERYTHTVFPLLDRVQIAAASRTVMSRTADSLVFATVLDSRFADDKEFPNRWRSLKKLPGNKTELGPPQPYDGAAAYLKVTRLSDPKGALLVEYHLVFVEPQDWFGGANLMRSKLPVLIQTQVRAFRKQLCKRRSSSTGFQPVMGGSLGCQLHCHPGATVQLSPQPRPVCHGRFGRACDFRLGQVKRRSTAETAVAHGPNPGGLTPRRPRGRRGGG